MSPIGQVEGPTGSTNGDVTDTPYSPFEALRLGRRLSGSSQAVLSVSAAGASSAEGTAGTRFVDIDDALTLTGLRPWTERVRDLARDIFGSAADLTPRLEDDPETGEQEVVFVVTYGITDPDLEELQDLHLRFLRRYAEEIPAEVRGEVVLVSES